MRVGEEMSAALERSELTLPSVTEFIMSPFVNSTQWQDSPGKYFVPPAVTTSAAESFIELLVHECISYPHIYSGTRNESKFIY